MQAHFQCIYPASWCAFLLSVISAAVAFRLAASGHLSSSYLRDYDPTYQGWHDLRQPEPDDLLLILYPSKEGLRDRHLSLLQNAQK